MKRREKINILNQYKKILLYMYNYDKSNTSERNLNDEEKTKVLVLKRNNKIVA